MDTTNKSVNIFLGKSEKKQLGITDDSSQSKSSHHYIIIQNDKLHMVVNGLREELSSVKTEYAELEKEADKSDESTRYLRNLNKNLVFLRNDDSDVNKIYESLYKNTMIINKALYELLGKIFKILYMTGISSVLVLSFLLFFGWFAGIVMFAICCWASYGISLYFIKFDKHTYEKVMNEYRDFTKSLSEKLKEIVKMKVDIKKTEDGLPNIIEFIDNV